MKSFLKHLLLLAIPLLLLQGCDKENGDNPDHWVRLKVNGEWKTLTEGFGLITPSSTSIDGHYFGSTFISEDGGESFTIGMNCAGDFATGTYDSNLGFTNMWVQYSTETPTANYDYELSTLPGLIPSRYIFTITKVTPTSIEGTFTGNYLYTPITYQPVQVTEGEFRARIEP